MIMRVLSCMAEPPYEQCHMSDIGMPESSIWACRWQMASRCRQETVLEEVGADQDSKWRIEQGTRLIALKAAKSSSSNDMRRLLRHGRRNHGCADQSNNQSKIYELIRLRPAAGRRSMQTTCCRQPCPHSLSEAERLWRPLLSI